jgi:hypothetical protein
MQLEKAEVGSTSGPTWRLSHLRERRVAEEVDVDECALDVHGRRLLRDLHLRQQQIVVGSACWLFRL